MLQSIVIGNVGADAQVKNKDGREYTTFRVAHNEQWTGQDGVQHSTTIWVDCIMNGHPKVTEFLKAGTLVVCIGRATLRVYSSEKDRCMKAGMTINVESVQLLGGSSDEVPRRLYDEHGVQHDTKKYYLTDVKGTTLMSQRGERFNVDANGWVSPTNQVDTNAAQSDDNVDRSADGAPSF